MRYRHLASHALALVVALSVAAPVFPSSAAEGAGGLTLGGALRRALTANPKLVAADREIGIASGKHLQAGAIPNPELVLELDGAFGTGDYRGLNSAEKIIGVGQLIELGGKRAARIAAGAAELRSAQWRREAVRLEILSDTAVAFFNVLGAQRRVEILDEQIAALDRLVPLLQKRVDAGASSPGEIARARVAADLVRAERARMQAALAVARRELAVLMGTPAATIPHAVGGLTQIGRLPPFQDLLRELDKNPQLVRWTAVRAQKDAELLSARLKPVPDLKIDVAWKHIREPVELGARNNQALRLGASIPIPVWDQNLGNIAAAQHERAKVEADHDAGRAALILMLGKAYDIQAGALLEIHVLRTSALPNARRAVTAIESGYSQGRFSLLELLDAQSTAAQVAQREQEALITFHTSVATIQGLTGISFGFARERNR